MTHWAILEADRPALFAVETLADGAESGGAESRPVGGEWRPFGLA